MHIFQRDLYNDRRELNRKNIKRRDHSIKIDINPVYSDYNALQSVIEKLQNSGLIVNG